MGLIDWVPQTGSAALAGMTPLSNGFSSFITQITTATWLANLVGTMIGVAVGGVVALYVLRRQLQSDRKLFQDTMEAGRGTEYRLRRRQVAVELALGLKPAADQLGRFDHLDVWADKWPDYDTCFDVITSHQNLLAAYGLYDLVEESLTAINITTSVWQSARRTVGEWIADHPCEYDAQDVRITNAMKLAELMTGRQLLQSLVMMLQAWDGDGQPELPDGPSVDELNGIHESVRRAMALPLSYNARLEQLDRLLHAGTITKKEWLARRKAAATELEDMLSSRRVPPVPPKAEPGARINEEIAAPDP